MDPIAYVEAKTLARKVFVDGVLWRNFVYRAIAIAATEGRGAKKMAPRVENHAGLGGASISQRCAEIV